MTLFLLSLTPRLNDDAITISRILALFTGKLIIPIAVNDYFWTGYANIILDNDINYSLSALNINHTNSNGVPKTLSTSSKDCVDPR